MDILWIQYGYHMDIIWIQNGYRMDPYPLLRVSQKFPQGKTHKNKRSKYSAFQTHFVVPTELQLEQT